METINRYEECMDSGAEKSRYKIPQPLPDPPTHSASQTSLSRGEETALGCPANGTQRLEYDHGVMADGFLNQNSCKSPIMGLIFRT